MGADSFATFHRWRRWRRIARMIPIAVFDRPDYTLAALSSPAARALAAFRLPQRAARLLPECTPPAWSFLFIRRCPESSTRLRALARRAKKLATPGGDNA
jgi:nicotinate-nucleotide adenylyltransferase